MLNIRHCRILGIVCLSFALGACSVVAVETTRPTPGGDSVLQSGSISGIEVIILQSIKEDRIRLLEENDVPNLIKKSMTESLKNGGHFNSSGTFKCEVLISNFFQSSWGGGTQVTLSVSVRDASSALVKRFDAHSYTSRAGNPGMTRVLSDVVQKALDQL